MQNQNENYGTQFPAWLGSLMGMTGGLGTAAGGLYNMFSKPKSPFGQAKPYLEQIPGKYEQYLSPYMQAGQGALSDLQNQYKDLLGGGTQAKLGESYTESPGYQFKLKSAMEAANRASAAGGGLGGVAHQLSSEDMGQKLASEDYDKYLQNQMQLYGLGLSGEQGLNQMGFQGAGSMADMYGNLLTQLGSGAYSAQAGENARKASSWKDLFGGLGTAGASALGGAGMGGWGELMKLFGGQGQGV